GQNIFKKDYCIHCSININTEAGCLSARRPSLQNCYKIRQAFIAAPGNSLIVADYGQRRFSFKNYNEYYLYIRDVVNEKQVLLEWHPQPGEDKPPVLLLK
ncbi:hypothetical protein HN51_068930, partial [Arachis hypogaea]